MDFLHASFLGYAIWLWLVFAGVVFTLLALDLGVLHRDGGEIGVTESLWLSAGYIAVAVVFGGWLWWQVGPQQGMDYFTAYAVEKSLSLDNVFVISLVFAAFAVPRQYQHRVLFWGILGVIVLRALLIGAGATLVQQFHWILYLFAAFLIYTGIKMLWAADHAPDPMRNPVLRLIRRVVPVTDRLHGNAFWVKQSDASGRMRRLATPLFMALVAVELADLVFAVDSVPAVFAVTADPFVVYTSNIFAILGLRALYFALAAILHRFAYLKYALALVLVFIGGKIIAAELIGKVPSAVSLAVTFGLLAAGVLFSLWKTRGAAQVTPAEQ
ncbi:TerC family protein [Thiomonas bhubaneswarensis]|uniref:Integral membrane protein, TerC family n=1 Tax=Thiomonas bhubaneswarensis TaxID=339866 RepID=A0A0K6HVQ7_9BURK|nr:TerC family protein [Thiomonas bhubaneswarensis]CUA94980.1 integral membrane protein, TerC family [Thiomonas bhubaneswarensis]